MNRIIKFRGKDFGGTWQYGNYIQFNDRHYISDGRGWNEVDPKTVGQFTGLYDSTKWGDLSLPEQALWTFSGNPANEWPGREIYEGDIIESIDQNNEISEFNSDTGQGVIEWLNDYGFWNVSSIENSLGDLIKISECGIKVIGNIHDNPKLKEQS